VKPFVRLDELAVLAMPALPVHIDHPVVYDPDIRNRGRSQIPPRYSADDVVIDFDEPPLVDTLDAGCIRLVFEDFQYPTDHSKRLNTHGGTLIASLTHSIIRGTIQLVHNG
jgi:hypothetical protein